MKFGNINLDTAKLALNALEVGKKLANFGMAIQEKLFWNQRKLSEHVYIVRNVAGYIEVLTAVSDSKVTPAAVSNLPTKYPLVALPYKTGSDAVLHTLDIDELGIILESLKELV